MSRLARPTRLALETMDDRLVPAVVGTPTLSAGTLAVTCDAASDNVTVSLSGSKLVVRDLTTGRSWQATAGSVGRVSFSGNNGNDRFVLNHSVPLTASGGNGNDYLEGANAADSLDGGAGNDELVGYGGDDTLTGGSGDDFLSGIGGVDLMRGGSGFDRYRDDFNRSQWAVGYQRTDVNQEASPICTIASAIAEAAEHVNLGADISHLGGDSYRVRLVKNGKWNYQTVTFNGTYTDNDLQPTQTRANGALTGKNNGEFWTTLYARAYLQLNGVNWNDPNTDNWGSAWKDHAKAQYAMSGWTTSQVSIPSNATAAFAQPLQGRVRAGNLVTAGGTGHAYAVVDVYIRNGVWHVKLYNPWGTDGVHNGMAYNGLGQNDGEIEVTWDTFRARFAHYTYARR